MAEESDRIKHDNKLTKSALSYNADSYGSGLAFGYLQRIQKEV